MTIQEAVTELVNKAVRASDSSDALKFSQAALNAAHAFDVWRVVQDLGGQKHGQD